MRSALQQQGNAAEQVALKFLLAKGLKPIAQNLASPLGEIDLLMQDADQWVFVAKACDLVVRQQVFRVLSN
jgi:Holliday junction resolvase-like predicted endonuclease